MDKNELGEPCEHLGDGAYITYTGDSVILTANHHDSLSDECTDKVYIGMIGAENLIRFLKSVGVIG